MGPILAVSYALALLAHPSIGQSWGHRCRRVGSFHYDASTHTDWRRKQESWPGSWGKSIHNPGIAAQPPSRQRSRTASGPNAPLKLQPVPLDEARIQAEGGGLLPSRPRLHRRVQCVLPTVSPPWQTGGRHVRGRARTQATDADRAALGAGSNGDTCLESQDAILRFPFPFPCWTASFSHFRLWHRSTRTI